MDALRDVGEVLVVVDAAAAAAAPAAAATEPQGRPRARAAGRPARAAGRSPEALVKEGPVPRPPARQRAPRRGRRGGGSGARGAGEGAAGPRAIGRDTPQPARPGTRAASSRDTRRALALGRPPRQAGVQAPQEPHELRRRTGAGAGNGARTEAKRAQGEWATTPDASPGPRGVLGARPLRPPPGRRPRRLAPPPRLLAPGPPGRRPARPRVPPA